MQDPTLPTKIECYECGATASVQGGRIAPHNRANARGACPARGAIVNGALLETSEAIAQLKAQLVELEDEHVRTRGHVTRARIAREREDRLLRERSKTRTTYVPPSRRLDTLHDDAILHALDQIARDTPGERVTSGPLYARYLEAPLPKPHDHITSRAFTYHLHALEQRGIVTLHVVSFGCHGRTTIIQRAAPELHGLAPGEATA